MPRFYEPDLGADPDSPFARDALDKLVRRTPGEDGPHVDGERLRQPLLVLGAVLAFTHASASLLRLFERDEARRWPASAVREP
jgi:hypothetical protein